jgi:prepilin-type N-terminal cleavage/methylation domain-containing protein/prepilin-type processing-associated H-X9-DG protein
MRARQPATLQTTPQFRRWANGFSLVELLMVIGIISVLIAILLPALNRARAEARKLACLSNMRQLGTALIMYTNDNSGYFPYQDESNITNNIYGIVDFATSTTPNFLQELLPYLNNNYSVFVCPDAVTSGPPFPANYTPTDTSNTNYLANGMVVGAFPQSNGVLVGRKISQVPNSSDIICLQENVYAVSVSWPRPYFNGSGTFALWHSPYSGWPSGETYCSLHDNYQSGNVMFCDGHGETRRFKENVAGDFGLNPPREPWTLTNESQTTAGQPYTPAF